MARFPISNKSISNQEAIITGSDYRHIVKVLRLKPGHEVVLFDETSFEHVGKISEINKTEIRVEILTSTKVNIESDTKITLLQGIPKGSKMDFIIGKATELGVNYIVPVVTERSQVRETNKALRWQRIAIEASKQCRSVTIPNIQDVIRFKDTEIYSHSSGLRLIFYENSRTKLSDYIKTVSQLPTTVIIFIGPEGGFSEFEINLAMEWGFTPVGLGPRTLRTETAAIVAVALIQHILGGI
ncbi:MAG: 16S rRNA (uracil(1498)-N(3))-methyltransferase [Thermodesulfobacteriota bacterium]